MKNLSFLLLTGFLIGCGGGGSGGPGANQSPVIDSISLTPASYVAPQQNISLSIVAHDPDGDAISYSWSTDLGTLDTTGGTTVEWTAPSAPISGTGTIEVSVSDGKGGLATARKTVLWNIPLRERTVFSVAPANPGAGEIVTFAWEFPQSLGETMICSLDVEADGIIDYTFDNCGGRSSQTYAYPSQGRFEPRFTAMNQFGDLAIKYGGVNTPRPIEIIIPTPRQDQVVDNILSVAVSVASAYEIKDIRAKVDDREISLLPGFQGQIPLEGLTHGSKYLRIVATDVLDNVAFAYRTFAFANRPLLDILSPPDQSVARPFARVRATCSDDSPGDCEITVRQFGTPDPPLLSGKNGIDADLNLSAWEGKSVRLQFEAKDSFNQTVTTERLLFVESSTSLEGIAGVGGAIFDVSTDRILFLEQFPTSNTLKIRNRASGQETVVSQAPGIVPDYGFLTPNGTIFATPAVGMLRSRSIFEWRNGSLLDFGLGRDLKAKGTYAVWIPIPLPSDIVLRDLLLGINTNITGGLIPDVSESGVVVTGTSNIFRYFNNSLTMVTNDNSVEVRNTDPLTDGNIIVYRKFQPTAGEPNAIALHDGSKEVTLTPYLTGSASVPGRDYQVNGGWVAFTNEGVLGQRHVWIRSPLGGESQITFFGTSSSIDHLAPNGETMILNDGRRYLADTAGSVKDVGSSLGRGVYLDGKWLVIIGGEIFEVLR